MSLSSKEDKLSIVLNLCRKVNKSVFFCRKRYSSKDISIADSLFLGNKSYSCWLILKIGRICTLFFPGINNRIVSPKEHR